MDFNELAKNLGLEEEDFLELTELFVKTSTSDLNKLRCAIEKEDVMQVIESAHSIKGSAGNLGFQEIYEAARGTEMKARKNNLAGESETIESIKENLDLIGKTLQKELSMKELDV